MKKFTKKIAAMGAAVMMAVSMMSMGASAESIKYWNIKYKNGAQGNHTSYIVKIAPSSAAALIQSGCDKFSVKAPGAKVEYNTYAINKNGNIIYKKKKKPLNRLTDDYKDRVFTQSWFKLHWLNQPVKKPDTLCVKYSLNYSNKEANVTGSVKWW